MTWRESDIQDIAGKRIVVTGANSGIGFEASRILAERGAVVTLAVRDIGRGEAAAASIKGPVTVAKLDLSDLSSVRTFATTLREQNPAGLDVLINNAGVMAIPRRETVDGFEMQFGTNHLGHFALTGLLATAIRPGGRVVTLSSHLHRSGRINFDDLQGQRSYDKWHAYSQSKLANLLFALELDRRARSSGADLSSIGAHPGYASTNLQNAGPAMEGSRISAIVASLSTALLAQSARAGSMPTLMAATDPSLPSGSYVGPQKFGGWRGAPGPAEPSDAARDESTAQRLWEVSSDLTGVTYPW